MDCPVPSELPEGYNVTPGVPRSAGLAVSIFGEDPLSGRQGRVERRGYFDCDVPRSGLAICS